MIKLNIEEELKEIYNSYFLMCSRMGQDDIIGFINKFLEERCIFPNEERIKGETFWGKPPTFEVTYGGKDVSGLLVSLLKKLDYDMHEVDPCLELDDGDFSDKFEVIYAKED